MMKVECVCGVRTTPPRCHMCSRVIHQVNGRTATAYKINGERTISTPGAEAWGRPALRSYAPADWDIGGMEDDE